MKSLTAVRKKSPNYPVEFKIKMVELSHRPEISVAQLVTNGAIVIHTQRLKSDPGGNLLS
ncbi:hypothetical protein [Escherichia coli]|uniref:hypothetical protein n=1 Tax=Escherichia coli TaxID=562 RepID=UPI0003EE5883|nr:hypothetical protein [Escherichia coli]